MLFRTNVLGQLKNEKKEVIYKAEYTQSTHFSLYLDIFQMLLESWKYSLLAGQNI